MAETINEPDIEIDDSECKQIKLPPYPRGVREWNNEIRYTKDPLDFKQRLVHKLYTIWSLYGVLVTSEKLTKLLDNGADVNSTEYEIKCILVDVIDTLGKALGDTNIVQELAWLTCEDQDKFLEKVKEADAQAAVQTPSSPPADPDETPRSPQTPNNPPDQ